MRTMRARRPSGRSVHELVSTRQGDSRLNFSGVSGDGSGFVSASILLMTAVDTDGDGDPDATDPDDDNNGVADALDAFPFDPTRSAPAATRLANISTRALVRTGGEVMIGGVIISGTEPKTIFVTGRGPCLDQFGVPNTLDDPQLQFFDVAGNLVDSNDDWADHPNQAAVPESVRPQAAKDAAIAVTVNPGAYTAIVRGVGGATGVGIVEAFLIE